METEDKEIPALPPMSGPADEHPMDRGYAKPEWYPLVHPCDEA